MRSIYLTRHGEALHNVNQNLWTQVGICDAFGLTMNGVNQTIAKARRLGEVIQGDLMVISSNAIRAVQTASIIAVTLDRLKPREIQRHSIDMLSEVPHVETSLPKEFDYTKFVSDPSYSAMCETRGKLTESFVERVHELISARAFHPENLQATNGHPTLLLVTHLNTINAILAAIHPENPMNSNPRMSPADLTDFCRPFVGREILDHDGFLELRTDEEGRLHQV